MDTAPNSRPLSPFPIAFTFYDESNAKFCAKQCEILKPKPRFSNHFGFKCKLLLHPQKFGHSANSVFQKRHCVRKEQFINKEQKIHISFNDTQLLITRIKDYGNLSFRYVMAKGI